MELEEKHWNSLDLDCSGWSNPTSEFHQVFFKNLLLGEQQILEKHLPKNFFEKKIFQLVQCWYNVGYKPKHVFFINNLLLPVKDYL